MFAIRTESSSMTKKRRTKVIIYTLLIILLAVGVPMIVNRLMENSSDTVSTVPADLSDQIAAKVNVEKTNSQADQQTITNSTSDTDQTATDSSATQNEVPTTVEPAETPEPTVNGQAVKSGSGYQIMIPTNWYYSFVDEGGYQSLNFGSQNFGPDNPYSVTMTNDVYGYIVPKDYILTDAVGGLANVQSVKTTQGQEISVKTYTGEVAGAGNVTQKIAEFTVNNNSFGLVFYAATSNTNQLDQLLAVIKTIAI